MHKVNLSIFFIYNVILNAQFVLACSEKNDLISDVLERFLSIKKKEKWYINHYKNNKNHIQQIIKICYLEPKHTWKLKITEWENDKLNKIYKKSNILLIIKVLVNHNKNIFAFFLMLNFFFKFLENSNFINSII